MNMNKTDIGILISMSIVVIFMSFTFPAMGLAGNNTNTSDIPRFDISNDILDITNEFPDRPNAPSKGTLNHSSTQFDSGEGQIQYEFGPGISGNGSVFIAVPQPDEVVISNLTGQTNATFTSNDTTKTVIWDGFTVDIHSIDTSIGLYEYLITERPEDKGFIASLPIVGTIFSAGNALAGTLAWIGSIIYFFVVSIFEVTITGIIVIVKASIFIFSTLTWLVSSYTSIVTAAPTGWISVVILIPAIALFTVFAKMAIMLIDVIWIG